MNWREFEHAGWERASGVYGATFEAATRGFAPALLEAVGIRKGMELLEVACGTEFVASAAAARGAVVTGVDFSASMVARSTSFPCSAASTSRRICSSKPHRGCRI